MKKYVKNCLAILLAALIPGTMVQAEGAPDDLYAQSAVLMDADTGRILFEKNGESEMPMASTTKIMTLLVTTLGEPRLQGRKLGSQAVKLLFGTLALIFLGCLYLYTLI